MVLGVQGVRPEKVGTARAHYTGRDGQPLLRELSLTRAC